MLRLSQVQGKRVYLVREGRKSKRLGKLKTMVFAPNGRQVVGALIHRPDIAGMIRQDDLFVGIDALVCNANGIECTMGDESFDEKARARLGISEWNRCIVWSGMDVRAQNGKTLGRVVDVSFAQDTGAVDAFYVIDGAVADTLIGSLAIPARMLYAYDAGCMVVSDDALELKPSGGLAAKAGEASAQAAEKAKTIGRKASAATSSAINRGSYQLGRTIGKTKRSHAAQGKQNQQTSRPEGTEALSSRAAKSLGKQIGKTRGMFDAFRREFEEGSK